MKKLLFTLAICYAASLFAQQKNLQHIATQLTNATIHYGYGAELSHTAKVNLGAGLQEIVLTNIATDIDPNTIQVGCPESIVLMSYRFNVKTEAEPKTKTPQLEKMNDTLKLFQKQQAALYNEYATTEDILNRTTKLIESNLTNNPKKEISSMELIKLVEFYTAKVEALKNNLYATQLKKTEADERIAALSARINEYNANNYLPAIPKGQIILQVMAKSPENANFTLSYFTNRAGWIPTYDMRIKSIDNSFKLAFKATVTQTTGIDWKDVKLTLSTSNPNQGSTMPVINPWYVNLYAPVLYETMAVTSLGILKKPRIAVAKDAADVYSVQTMNDDENKTGETNNVAAYTTISESRLNTSFEIDLPYDIPSDGKAYSVAIKDELINAGYKHFAVPRFDNDAFLMAEISDWETLDLLPGDANIVMDNVYLGKSFINPNTTQDTLRLSLGRDKRIAIKRTTVKELTKSKVKGDNKSETFTYEITVKNNKKQPIDMVVTDQYPLSHVKEIEIKLDDDGKGKVNTETGAIEWSIQLEPGESKKMRFGYTVKYPRDKVIKGLR